MSTKHLFLCLGCISHGATRRDSVYRADLEDWLPMVRELLQAVAALASSTLRQGHRASGPPEGPNSGRGISAPIGKSRAALLI